MSVKLMFLFYILVKIGEEAMRGYKNFLIKILYKEEIKKIHGNK